MSDFRSVAEGISLWIDLIRCCAEPREFRDDGA